jgi:hypothetical protein
MYRREERYEREAEILQIILGPHCEHELKSTVRYVRIEVTIFELRKNARTGQKQRDQIHGDLSAFKNPSSIDSPVHLMRE